MNCIKCGATTEVTEKRGPFRDRRCTNLTCAYSFTTCEYLTVQSERERLCARALHRRLVKRDFGPVEEQKAAVAG